MTLTQDELQSVRELKTQGFSNSQIMGFIAANRAGQPSRVSQAFTTSEQVSLADDIGEDLATGGRRIADDLGQRFDNIKTAFAEADRGQTSIESGFQIAGNALGAAGDVVGGVAQTGAKLFTTEDQERALSEGISSAIQKTGLPEKFQNLSDREKRNLVASLGLVEGVSVGAAGVGTKAASRSLQQVSKVEIKSVDDAVEQLRSAGITEAGEAGITRSIDLGLSPDDLMQRVARISKGKQTKFEERAGQSVGQYLVDRNIFGTPDEVIDQLVTRLQKSKDRVDRGLSSVPGQYKSPAIKTAIDDLVERDAKVSTIGAPSPDSTRISELSKKHSTSGLSLGEVNEIKRLYERNVRVDYLNPANPKPEKLVRATNVDSALRNFVEKKAAENGFANVKSLNRETSLAKQLADDLGAEYMGSAGNNAVSITDWILIAEAANSPTAAAALGVKKTLGSKRVMSATARLLSANRGISADLPSGIDKSATLPSYRAWLSRNPAVNGDNN